MLNSNIFFFSPGKISTAPVKNNMELWRGGGGIPLDLRNLPWGTFLCFSKRLSHPGYFLRSTMSKNLKIPNFQKLTFSCSERKLSDPGYSMKSSMSKSGELLHGHRNRLKNFKEKILLKLKLI